MSGGYDPSNAARDRKREAARPHGFYRSKACDCDLCTAYQRGYAAGAQSKYNNKRRDRVLYADDPYLNDLLP